MGGRGKNDDSNPIRLLSDGRTNGRKHLPGAITKAGCRTTEAVGTRPTHATQKNQAFFKKLVEK
jgi:hypothetical protein